MLLSSFAVERLEYIVDTVANGTDLEQEAKKKDPIRLLYRYNNPLDIEAAGLLTSCLSYGKQSVFVPVIESVLAQLGDSPHNTIMSGDLRAVELNLEGFKYRFNSAEDIVGLLRSLQSLYKENATLEQVVGARDGSVKNKLSYLVTELRSRVPPSKGFNYLLPDPHTGSACKRLNMFLRWMVRKGDVDLGVWEVLKPKDLIIPLDTHIHRISQKLNITKRKTADWKTAEDITDSLSYLDENDPVKYDFILCSAGIAGML